MGSEWIDRDRYPSRGCAAAEAYTVSSGHPGTASVTDGKVTVIVRYRIPTSILGIVGISSLSVSATASAVNVYGVTKEDSLRHPAGFARQTGPLVESSRFGL